jgi:aspartate kinase
MDSILALGEDLSSLIIHSYLVSQGIKITWLNVRDYIITDDTFGKGVPDLNAILDRAKNLPNGLCITQGFIGSTVDGRTTTLGRGGSDYSAALLAEAIRSDELLIYTDVQGVYTQDPNLVSDAQLLPKLSFQKMAEMANFGAKVLHPATLGPCVRANIPIRVLSTFEPSKLGTYIND